MSDHTYFIAEIPDLGDSKLWAYADEDHAVEVLAQQALSSDRFTWTACPTEDPIAFAQEVWDWAEGDDSRAFIRFDSLNELIKWARPAGGETFHPASFHHSIWRQVRDLPEFASRPLTVGDLKYLLTQLSE